MHLTEVDTSGDIVWGYEESLLKCVDREMLVAQGDVVQTQLDPNTWITLVPDLGFLNRRLCLFDLA